MATKDISDAQVVVAFARMMLARRIACETDLRPNGAEGPHYADEFLACATGQPMKVCYRAMERACRRGLVDYGMWLRGGWLGPAGMTLLDETDAGLADEVRALDKGRS